MKTAGERGRTTALCVLVTAANLAVWGWAGLACGGNPVLLGTAFLAYAFGLRHAFDADHIAAIDNATRKLIEAGRRATATGFYFSLGHATVVVLAALAVALTSARLQTGLASLKPWASALATGVSALSLFALAIANAVILVSVCRLLAALRRGEQPIEAELRRLLAQRGLLGRLLRGTFRLISQSWQMYPLGFLFGLGFDTATEVALFGVSAAQASRGLSLATIVVFPALFTAGMVLVDTLDAVLMAGAYRWASLEPLRKLYYNLVITLASVAVALAVGGIEVLGLLGNRAGAGAFWRVVTILNDHLFALGSLIVAGFAISWLVSLAIWRRRSVPTG
jgi:nickel/cobalt transporter (NiCoT) family protein